MKKPYPIGLCLNDAHVGKETITDFEQNWYEAVDYAVEYDVKTLFVGGDTFLSRVAQTLPILLTVQKCIKYATEKGIDVVTANGNHDKVSLEDIRGYCHVFSDIPGYKVVDEYENFVYGDVAIHMMPYFPETGSFKKRLKEVNTIPGKKNILYIHQGINGGLGRSDDTNNKELPTHIFEEFDTVLVAHYHNRLHLKGTNIHYVGSSRQHNFGEDMAKGYTLIHSDGSFSFLENKVNTKYKTLTEDYAEIDKDFFSDIRDYADGGYKVRVIIHCKSTERKSINKRDFVEAGASKVEIIEEKITKEGVTVSCGTSRYNKEGLKDAYVEFLTKKDDVDAEFGLKYLDLIRM